jgi:hypothetical protein
VVRNDSNSLQPFDSFDSRQSVEGIKMKKIYVSTINSDGTKEEYVIQPDIEK